MQGLLIWPLVFVASLTVLVKASDFLVQAAEEVGQALAWPQFITGVIIVGVGTSLPELVSSVFAVFSGTSEIVVGNVLGSNITNIFLILGIAGVMGRQLRIRYDLMKVDLPVFLISAVLIAFMIADGKFSLGEAALCMVGLAIYLLNAIKGQQDAKAQAGRKPVQRSTWIKLIATPFLIFVSAKFTVDSVIALSTLINIGAEVIALSAVSLGTSLPEVLVTVSAARKGKAEIAIGNVVGSNIFNSLAVMGIPGLAGPLFIPQSVITFSLPFFLAATLIALVITVDRKINLWEGGLLLLCYLFFLGKLFGVV